MTAHHPPPDLKKPCVALPPLGAAEDVAEDYATLGLSLRDHPMRFLRKALRARGLVSAADLTARPNGAFLRIAGLVLFRQRPGTAKGTIFVTIEDESGTANLIVWPKLAEKYRSAVFGAKLLFCAGVLQKESSVIHVVSRSLADWTSMLRAVQSAREALPRIGRNGEVHFVQESGTGTRISAARHWIDTLKSRDFR